MTRNVRALSLLICFAVIVLPLTACQSDGRGGGSQDDEGLPTVEQARQADANSGLISPELDPRATDDQPSPGKEIGPSQGPAAGIDTTQKGRPVPGGPAQPTNLNQEQLTEAVRLLADQYREVMGNAADFIATNTEDPVMRSRAGRFKLNGATAMYDIAVDPLPANAMLNEMVLVSLQANMLERHGEQLFGDYHPLFLERAQFIQEEVFRLAAKVMTDQQRLQLLAFCNAWSEDNPKQLDVWHVRLNDLPAIKAGVSSTDVIGSFTNLPGEFLNKFNPFAKAQDVAGDAAALAERMSWLAPRLMILAQWRVELVIHESLAAPEIRGVLDSVDRLTVVAEELPQTITEQREGLFNDLSENEGTLTNLLNRTQATIGTVESLTGDANTLIQTSDTLVQSTDELVNSLDRLAQRAQAMQQLAVDSSDPNKPEGPPGRPFDITEYTQAINSLNGVVKDTNTLVGSLDDATSAKAIDRRLEAVQGTISNLIWLAGGVVLGVIVLSVLAVKLIPSRRHPNHDATT